MTLVKKQSGFTLIELLIVMVIIGVLAGLAVPFYTDYMIKSRITQATAGLSTKKTQMEQFFQDNHFYAQAEILDGGGSVVTPAVAAPPCATDSATSQFFTFSCVSDAMTFTLTATGRGPMAGFIYTINQANQKTSDLSASVYSSWATTSLTCWITGKSGVCG
jgi:type IV pilus assembly protein PilE